MGEPHGHGGDQGQDQERKQVYVIPRYNALESDIKQLIRNNIPNTAHIYENNHHSLLSKTYPGIITDAGVGSGSGFESSCVSQEDCNQVDVVLYFPRRETPIYIIEGGDDMTHLTDWTGVGGVNGLGDVGLRILEMRRPSDQLDGLFMIVNDPYSTTGATTGTVGSTNSATATITAGTTATTGRIISAIKNKIRSVLYPIELIPPVSTPLPRTSNKNMDIDTDTYSDAMNLTPLYTHNQWLTIQYIHIYTQYHTIIQQFHIIHELIHGIGEIRRNLQSSDMRVYNEAMGMLNDLYVLVYGFDSDCMGSDYSTANNTANSDNNTDNSDNSDNANSNGSRFGDIGNALGGIHSRLVYLLHTTGSTASPGITTTTSSNNPDSRPDRPVMPDSSIFNPLSPLSRHLIFNYEHKIAIYVPYWVPIIYPLFVGLYSVLFKSKQNQNSK